MPAPGPIPMDVLAKAALHLQAAKYFQVAAFVMLVWDHIITFQDEVDKIWKRKITGASILFLLNRYLSPLETVVTIIAFNDPTWPHDVCSRFVRFEGGGTLALVCVCEVIMILRVYALYKRNNWVLGFLLSVWITGTTVAAIGMTQGFALDLPPPLFACVDEGPEKSLFPALWVAPLVTNTCIFALTLWRSREFLMQPGFAPTIHVFVRDGTIYFLLIFVANLVNTIIYFAAEPDLKAIGGCFSQLLTATMVSRLVLNLRASGEKTQSDSLPTNETPVISTFMIATIGNLGEDLESFGGIMGDEKAQDTPKDDPSYWAESTTEGGSGEEYPMGSTTHRSYGSRYS